MVDLVLQSMTTGRTGDGEEEKEVVEKLRQAEQSTSRSVGAASDLLSGSFRAIHGGCGLGPHG